MNNPLFQLIINEELQRQLLSSASFFVLLLFAAVCILVLSKGADWMIDGAVNLAVRTGLPRIVIGATIISLGTTLPEAFVSVMAAYMGNSGLALGNGVGSIIADTGMIFGLACILRTIPVNQYILNRTGWVQVAAATLLVVIAVVALIQNSAHPQLERWVGFFFLVLLALYLYVTYRWAKTGEQLENNGEENGEEVTETLGKSFLLVVGGLTLVILGARGLVPSTAEIAVRLGVPDDVIAATIVAFGTSLPELMTAIAALRKGYPEIIVGNIVGADVLNCLFVVGSAAAATPLDIPENFYYFHFPVMLLILYSFRFFISINKDGTFRRWQGIWLLGVYLLYIFVQYFFNITHI